MLKKHSSILLLCLLISLICSSWGFYGHKSINKHAVYTLPSPMIGFFKRNIQFLEKNAVNPDQRRYIDSNEAPRHYIDIDYYGEHAFDSVPMHWKDAVAKYSEDTLKAYGIVPWHIHSMLNRLTRAFENRDSSAILKTAADLGHYIADAHVPLHTTMNYNGQMTGQHGIHGFWESRLPELFAQDYSFFVGRAEYISNPLEQAWSIVKASHQALDSVLRFEKEISQQMGEDIKYSFERKGNKTIKVYSFPFSKAYHEALNGMVELRMKASIHMVGSFWYNLNHLDMKTALEDSISKADSIHLERLQQRSWIGRSED
jgi:hypothetical protein